MPGILCEHCVGYCCRYIALPIDTPEQRSDFDDIRWYLLHQGVSVFVEDGEWYINVETTCRHLQPDNRCGIYTARPKICRDYTTDNFDYHSGDYGWEHHFTRPEHLDEYVRLHFVDPRRKRRGAKGAGRRPRGGAKGGPHAAGPRRPHLKAHLSPKLHRSRRGFDYAASTTDSRGVPLPLFPWTGSARG